MYRQQLPKGIVRCPPDRYANRITKIAAELEALSTAVKGGEIGPPWRITVPNAPVQNL